MSARLAFRRPLEQSAKRSGSVLSGDDRCEDRAAADAQDVGDHARQLHVRVFQRLLQPVRVPCDLTDQLLAGSCQIAQCLNRGRRHEAAPNQPVRQQVGDSGRIVPVALATGIVLDPGRSVTPHRAVVGCGSP